MLTPLHVASDLALRGLLRGSLRAHLRPQPPRAYAGAMGAELARKRASWGSEGACNSSALRDAYTQDGKLNKRDRDAMRKTCRVDCPVFKNCRAWAIVHSLDYFIAGMMPYEVAALRSNEIEKWGYEAYKWGWLEEDNLLTKAQLQKFVIQLREERRRARKPPAVLPESYDTFVVPEFNM